MHTGQGPVCGPFWCIEMEIERKFLVRCLPAGLEKHKMHMIEQAYLNTDPVVRVRREDDDYYITYKGRGLIAREEYNLPLNKDAYDHLKGKADGNVISKRRYLIPLGSPTAELDVFEGVFEGLCVVEVEFESLEQAESFIPPAWFGRDVSQEGTFQNSRLSSASKEQIKALISASKEASKDPDGGAQVES